MTTMYSRLRLTLTAASFALLAANLQGCDYEASSSPQQPAAVRRPDFQGGPLTVYYTSQATADVVLAGVTHKIGQGVAQSGLPFECEWEDDGDINLLYQGVPYEVESPYDALDDTLDLLKAKKKHKAKTAVSMAALKRPVASKSAALPPLPKTAPPAASLKPVKTPATTQKKKNKG
ncbi:hypothetical protein [Candidatus Electronema sp. JM]|uniref:hypothetical protein n=1 Tax=Candidatus Electronema sp. JM TaxID=3401571 RepID=UPI003AA8B40A